MTEKKKVDYTSVDSRRSDASRRTMSASRRLYYALGLPVLRAIMKLLTLTYRYQKPLGMEHIEPFIAEQRLCAPCYWHQHHILCSNEVRDWIGDGFKACFLVSGSVDGEVPARLARSWGAEVIRGSANQSGALALRDMQAMMKRGYSIVTTADGPRGPKYEFKAGTALMARIANVPMVPVSCAADRAWYLNRWDDFMIPKPFARVIIGIGAPYAIPPKTPLDAIEPHRVAVQEAVRSLMRECEDVLQAG